MVGHVLAFMREIHSKPPPAPPSFIVIACEEYKPKKWKYLIEDIAGRRWIKQKRIKAVLFPILEAFRNQSQFVYYYKQTLREWRY